jgi:hypothetical protein
VIGQWIMEERVRSSAFACTQLGDAECGHADPAWELMGLTH